MSKLAYHVGHYKQGAVGQLAGHNYEHRSEYDSHSNQDIDPSRSGDNMILLSPDKPLYAAVKERIQDTVTGRIRSDSNWITETITYPPEGMTDPQQLRSYFQDVVSWHQEMFGKDNVLAATVHLDETTPHMHLDLTPITEDGKLSTKQIFTRAALTKQQTDLAAYLSGKGWDIQRGDSTKGRNVHAVSVREFKKQAAAERAAIDLELAQKSQARDQAAADLERIQQEQIRMQEQLIQARQESAAIDARIKQLRSEEQAQQEAIIAGEKKIQEANEWLNQIPDWPTYEKTAMKAWNALDSFKQLLQDTFSSSWIFRNRAAEKAILEAVTNLRDYVMTAISAMRGYEVRERLPENRQRSQVISHSLDELIAKAKDRLDKQPALPKGRSHHHNLER